MLIDELKKANIEALKAKDKNARAALSVVINKFNMLSIELKTENKEAGDVELIAIISKTLKELTDEKAGYTKVNNQERVDAVIAQEATLKTYLPAMLNDEEIKNEILKLADKSIPTVMAHFKQSFNGKVDMGLVSKVARSL